MVAIGVFWWGVGVILGTDGMGGKYRGCFRVGGGWYWCGRLWVLIIIIIYANRDIQVYFVMPKLTKILISRIKYLKEN